jgi:UDP-glucose 4-epimerase
MNVLLTGATGFVGKYVADELKKVGEVVALGRKGDIVFDLANNPTSSDRAQLPSSIDAVVHLASLTQKTKNDTTKPEEYHLQNVAGTKHLLDLLDESTIKQFIYVSTLDVYGDTRGKPITEDISPNPQSPYAKSKYEAERLCDDWTTQRNIPLCIARLGLVYGPGEEAYEKVIPQYIRAALANKPLKVYGSGEVTRDFIYAADVARALQLIVEKKTTGIYNIASGETVTIADLAQLVNTLAANISGVRYIQTTKQQQSITFDVTKLHNLGFAPKVSLVKGLSKEITWFKNL